MTHNGNSVRLRPIALPAEHGSWGFLLEPVLLGLALAPSLAGLALALAVVAAFLIRNPVRIFLRGRRLTRSSKRLPLARTVALLYALVTALGVAVCVLRAGFAPLAPLLVVAPLAVLFTFYDATNRGREFVAEIAGAVGLAAAAPAIALAGGWPAGPAWVTWVIVVVKALPTVVYIRARLRLEGGSAVNRWPSASAHVLGLAIATWLWARGMSPLLTAVFLALMMARAAVGLTGVRWGRRPKQIGVLEFVFSGLYVVVTAIGFHASL